MRFKLRHGAMWLLYVWLLKLNFDLLRDARASSGASLLPAILVAWAAVFTAGANIARWLEAAKRYWPARIALTLTAGFSAVLGAWMLWHYTVFLMVGLITLFRRPMELITLAVFGERLLAVSAALLTYFTFSWFALRVGWLLVSGRPDAVVERVLGDSGAADARVQRHLPQRPKAQVLLAQRVRASTPGDRDAEPAGKQRYLRRPPELTPSFDGTYERTGPPVLQGAGHAPDADPRSREKCQAIGWPAFEWVLRTQPSPEEVVMALQALPHLATSVDADDAAEAREWISRLADHPGHYEHEAPYRDAMDRVPDVTIRIADVAVQCLMDWDHLREQHRLIP